jgi:AraC-like DNA-binding protein
MEKFDLLSKVDPYRILSGSDRRCILKTMLRREYQAGELLIAESGWIDHIGFLFAGRAEVLMAYHDNAQIPVYHLYPGEFFGDLACLTDRKSLVSVVCRETTIVYMQRYKDFMRSLETHPAMKSYFMKSAFHKLWRIFQIERNGYSKKNIHGFRNTGIPKSMKKAIEFIESNFDRPITVIQVAKASGLSKSVFSRRFKEHMGVPFKSYLNQMRIVKAKYFISHQGMNVTEACFAVGFNDIAHFSRTFRKLEGISPSHHKNRMETVLP